MNLSTLYVFLIIFFSFIGCEKNIPVPQHLIGEWRTSAAQYEDRYLKIAEHSLIFGIGDGEELSQDIEKVNVEQENGETIYTIHYKDIEGIGKIKNSVGNEDDLVKMIADMAAVALLNRTMLSEAKHEANTDPLTGLHNRNYFRQMGQTFLEKAIRESTPISIVLFDIDNFKHYNDTNGHDAGDRLLIELSQLVNEMTRKNTVFARYGGEEFIAMLSGISGEGALIYAERVREAISKYSFAHREKQPMGYISVSGGVACFPYDGDTLDKVIQLADKSLYQAKSEGRNRIILHKPYHFSEQEEIN